MHKETRKHGTEYEEIKRIVFNFSDGIQEIIYVLSRETDNPNEKFLYFLSNRLDFVKQKGKSKWVEVYRKQFSQEKDGGYEIKRQPGRCTVLCQVSNMHWRGQKVAGRRILFIKKYPKNGR